MKYISKFILILCLIAISGCSSSPPDELIEKSIVKKFPNPNAFQLNSWSETNSYTREVSGEEVYILEYESEFELKPKYKKYLNSGGGISFPNEFYESKGNVSFVERGSKWYSFE